MILACSFQFYDPMVLPNVIACIFCRTVTIISDGEEEQETDQERSEHLCAF